MLLITMARLADGETLTGYHSQATIAAAMGCSVSTVKRLWRGFPQMVEAGLAPVDIKRRRRGRTDGTGRDSDQWTLVLLRPAPGLNLTPSAERDETSRAQTTRLKGSNDEAQGVNLTHDLPLVSPLSPREEEKAPSVLTLAKDEKAKKVAFPDGWWKDREFIATNKGIAFRLARLVADFEASHSKADLNAFGRYLDAYAAKRANLPKVWCSKYSCQVTVAELAEVEADAACVARARAEAIAAQMVQCRASIERMPPETKAEFDRMLKSGQYTPLMAIDCLRSAAAQRRKNVG